ncbi:MAG: hypothetical protein Q9181_003983 [Wetmoreana brouardii]
MRNASSTRPNHFDSAFVRYFTIHIHNLLTTMRTKQDPLRRVRDGAITKSSASDNSALSIKPGVKIIDLTSAGKPGGGASPELPSPKGLQALANVAETSVPLPTELPEPNKEKDAPLPDKPESPTPGHNTPDFLHPLLPMKPSSDHVGLDEESSDLSEEDESSEDSNEYDDDDNNAIARRQNKAAVATLNQSFALVEDSVYDVRIEHKFIYQNDYTTVEGTYTHLADANAAALSWFSDAFGSGIEWDEYKQEWYGDEVHITASGFEEESFEISIGQTKLHRRVPKI